MIKLPAFICDVDGTLADHEGIRGHFEYEKVSLDRPIRPVIKVVKLLVSTGELNVVLVSGRMDSGNCRRDTLSWLSDNLFPIYDDELFMRSATLPDGKPDYRPDYIVKEEIYRRDIEPKYDVKFAIDDRPAVIRLWRSLGITTFAVGDLTEF